MASINEIATSANVSRQVVSKVLNGGQSSAGASKQTRERILRIAREMGYRPNAAAKAISTGRFNAVGLVMSEHHHQSTLFGRLLRGIHEQLDKQAYHLTINFIDDARLTSEEELPKVLGQAMVDGIFLNYTHGIPPRLVELIRKHRIPSVWLNAKREHSCVHLDDEGATRQATKRLLELGHSRIVYADFTGQCETATGWHYSRFDRRAGYESAMREAGHEPLVIMAEGDRDALGIASKILMATPTPSAVVTYGGPEAEAFAYAATARGLQVGQEIRLITFAADCPPGRPPMDVYQLPELELGRAAAAMLLRRIDTGGEREDPIAIPMNELHPNCRPASAGRDRAEDLTTEPI